MKKYLIYALIFTIVFSGCLRKKFQTTTEQEHITLTFYGLFDDEELYTPIIESFQDSYNYVTIVYKKFTDSQEYLNLIVNELAEGEGPDIFMMHNSWFPKHYKKLTPAPTTVVTTESYRNAFVEIASNEMIIPDSTTAEYIYGVPIYIDTLALYYNKDHFEDAIPSQGRPSDTWDGIVSDVLQLNREDKSFERFERSGIAMGRSDNILRAFDILMMLMLQYKVDFYSDDLKEAVFDNDSNALSALDLYTSFGLPSQQNYSWNKYISDAESDEKEITTFAKGKVSMIFGYSYTYEAILNEIERLKSLKEDVIEINSVQIQESPQVFDPDSSSETREAFASYFAPVVSRTSAHSDMAWAFLATLVSEENQQYLYEETHRPSGRRSLLETQMQDPVYGAFAAQVGYSESLPMVDWYDYKEIFLNAIDLILNTESTSDVLKLIVEEIQDLIPSTGIKPVLST